MVEMFLSIKERTVSSWIAEDAKLGGDLFAFTVQIFSSSLYSAHFC